MSAKKLGLLLSEGGITPGNVTRLAALCSEWFAAEPSVKTFVLRGIFRELADAWDGEQGLPSSKWQQFDTILLPKLKAAINLIETHPSDPAIGVMNDVVLAFDKSMKAAINASA